MTKIKICGLCRNEDIAYVNNCDPDYIGFIFANSRRKVTREQARELRKRLHSNIVPVGVFVNESVETVAEIINDGIIDVAQLHGDETPKYMNRLRSLIKKGEIVKAVRVSGSKDIENSKFIDADYLLFDTFSAAQYGGTGKTFDWNILSEVTTPFFLAGGINSDNVKKAIRIVHPYAVDVSSSVETDGWKDPNKIIEIVNKVRSINDI